MTQVEQPCECGKVLAPDEHHCFIHHADEYEPDPYIVCGECFHVYETAEALENTHQANFPDSPSKIAIDISCCPECIHDF